MRRFIIQIQTVIFKGQKYEERVIIQVGLILGIRNYQYAIRLIIRERILLLRYYTMDCFGARNTVGFSSQIQSGSLPSETHITYEGVFNQIKFDVGQKTDLIKDLHLGYARYQFMESAYDNKINDYLALFVKSCKDGSDRDQTPLHSLLCLDISGSMGSGLGGYNSKEFRSRLSLSVQAIKMFISKLRPNDSVGIITFNDQAQIILEPTFKANMPGNIFDRLDQIKVSGGTTIRSGFQMAVVLLEGWISSNKLTDCQNRIIMLTDVNDNSIQNQQKFLSQASDYKNINLTIIGISDDFKSQVCEYLKDVRGFNYFCAVKQEDIKKYVFETFDFGFLPSAYDLEITLHSKDIKSFQVFGAPDSASVPIYNKDFKQQTSDFTISRLKSTFPSEIQIVNSKVMTYGGLILLKLNRRSQDPFFKGGINLRYTDIKGKKYEQKYELNYEFPPFQQYFSEESLKQALEAYTFTAEMKNILKEAKNIKKLSQVYDKYWPMVASLETIIPKSKTEDLENIKKIISQSKKPVYEAAKLEEYVDIE